MDHRGIPVCKGHFRLDLLARRGRHAEQHLENSVRRIMFSGKIQRVFDLGQNLILSQDLGFQSSRKIEKMLHSLLARS